MFAVPFELASRPTAHNDIEGFGEPQLGRAPVGIESRVLQRMHAASSAEVQTAVGKQIKHRKILGDSHRMVHRQQGHGATKPHPLGSLRSRGEKKLWVRQHAAEIAEVMLRGPHRVEAERLRRVDLLEPMGVELGTLAVQLRHVSVEKVVTEFHDGEISLGFEYLTYTALTT